MGQINYEEKTEVINITKTHLVPKDVTLTLSFEEAQTLMELTAALGGSERTSLRKHTQSIYEKLFKLKFRHNLGYKPIFIGGRCPYFEDGYLTDIDNICARMKMSLKKEIN